MHSISESDAAQAFCGPSALRPNSRSALSSLAYAHPAALATARGPHEHQHSPRAIRSFVRSRSNASLRWSSCRAFGHRLAWAPAGPSARTAASLPAAASAIEAEAAQAETGAGVDRAPVAPGEVLEFVASGSRLIGVVQSIAENGKTLLVAPLAAEAKPSVRVDAGQIIFRWPAGCGGDELREAARGGARERDTARHLRRLPRSAEELWTALRRSGEKRVFATSESLARSFLADRSGRADAPALYAAHRLLAASDPYFKRAGPGEGYEAAAEQEVRAKKMEPIVRWLRARIAGDEAAGEWAIAWAPELHALELAAIEGNDAGVPTRAVPTAARRVAAALVAAVGGLPKGGPGARLALLRSGLWTLREGAAEEAAAGGAAAFLASCEPFSASALDEAAALGRRADAFAAAAAAGRPGALEGRRDLRAGGRWGPPLALDPGASSAADDAFSAPLKPSTTGDVEVAVHIADAARLLSPQSELARYAYLRSQTMYLPTAVVPMLPAAARRALALRDDAPNAAVTAALRFDGDSGEIRSVDVFRSLLPPVQRLTHAAADAGGGPEAPLAALAAVAAARSGAGRAAAAAGRFGATMGRRLLVGGDGGVRVATALRGGAAGAVATLLDACAEGLDAWAASRPEGAIPLPQIAPWDEQRKLPGTAPVRRFPDLFHQWQLCSYLASGRPRYERRAVDVAGRWANARLRAVGDVEEAARRHWGLVALERAAAAAPDRTLPAAVEEVLEYRRGVYRVRCGPEAGTAEATVRGPRGLEAGQAVRLRVERVDVAGGAVTAFLATAE